MFTLYDYREHLTGLGLSPATIRCYVEALVRLRRWADSESIRFDKLGPTQVAAYAETVPASWATRRHLRSALIHWANMTKRQSLAGAVRVPRKPKMVCRAYDPDEVRMIALTAYKRQDGPGAAVLCALYLGLRRAEIAALRWDAFSDDGEWVTVTGKGQVTATLPVHPVLKDALKRLPRSDAYVFPGKSGGPSSPARIWNWIRRVGAEAGVEDVEPHRLRHSCLAMANDALGDLRAVQAFARHARPETTAGYTRATAASLRRVSQSLDYLDDLR